MVFNQPKQDALARNGFTLIEVMIALAIFAIGFLAVAGMQIHALNSTTHSRNVTNALALAQREVERLRGIPLYDPDLDLDGNKANEMFDYSPDFDASVDHVENAAWAGPYTIRWTVVDDKPLAAIPDVWSGAGGNVTISKTITITVTPDNDANSVLARVELVKVWQKDGW